MNTAIRAVVFGVLMISSIAAWADTRTITGKVSCSMCRGNHQMGKKSDAECVRACVKYGAKYVLVSGDEIYMLPGDSKQYDFYADKTITIRGEVEQDHIVKIETISLSKQ